MNEHKHQTTQDRSVGFGTALGWVALVLILGGALGRASVAADPMPFWDTDPLITLTTKTGLGPTAQGALDVLALLGCAVAIMSCSLRGDRVSPRLLALLGVGWAGVALHALIVPFDPAANPMERGSLNDLLTGGAWGAALAGGVGLAHLRGRARNVGLALCLGFVVMLASKGALQQFIEHPVTVRDYQAQRESVLASRGWSPESSMAQAYERRLRQNDASGWFGLSNVYATFGAIGLVVLAGLGVQRARGGDHRAGVVLGVGALCSLGMLLMSHSKGGLGAGVIGLIALALIGSGLARGRWRALLLAGAPLAVLALVVVRGLLGERLGELSLLFRWHYMQGSVGILLEHPWLGVGPSGFKDAYLLTRPPLGVEEVTSPHNALLDWTSTLGLFGLAWAGLGLLLVTRSGRGPLVEAAPAPVGEARENLMIVALCAAGVTGASAMLESSMATPESAAARLVGLLGWVAVAWAALRALRSGTGSWTRGALGGGAAVIAAHAMIEVTPVWHNSAALLGATLGLLAGGDDRERTVRSRVGVPMGVGVALLGAMLLSSGLARVSGWERSLGRAAAAVRPAAEIRDRLWRLNAGGGLVGDSADAIARDLAGLLGEPAATTPGRFEAQMRTLARGGGERAYAILEEALDQRPRHFPTRRALGRLALTLSDLDADGPPARAWRERAIALAQGGVERQPSSAAAWAWLGSTRFALWTQGRDPEDLELARRAWSRGVELDPLGLTLVVRLMDASEQLGDHGAAARWGGEALRLDELKRLDPLKRMSERERSRARRLSTAAEGSGP